jgi:hypothetical protein
MEPEMSTEQAASSGKDYWIGIRGLAFSKLRRSEYRGVDCVANSLNKLW